MVYEKCTCIHSSTAEEMTNDKASSLTTEEASIPVTEEALAARASSPVTKETQDSVVCAPG